MTREEAREFALRWLPAWKRNEVYFDRTELVKKIDV